MCTWWPNEEAIALLDEEHDEYALQLLERMLDGLERLGTETMITWLETQHERLRRRSPLTCIKYGLFALVIIVFDADFSATFAERVPWQS